MKKLLATGACLLALGAVYPAGASAAETESHTFALTGADGEAAGDVTLMQTDTGLLVTVEARGLEPGWHGLHIHENPVCDPADEFKSAGGHWNPEGHAHGYYSEGGPHGGDLPNMYAAADGTAHYQAFAPWLTLENESEEAASLPGVLDGEGRALMIHAGADDYSSQPSGDAGGRAACAVLND